MSSLMAVIGDWICPKQTIANHVDPVLGNGRGYDIIELQVVVKFRHAHRRSGYQLKRQQEGTRKNVCKLHICFPSTCVVLEENRINLISSSKTRDF